MEFQNNMLSPLNALEDKTDSSKGASLIGYQGKRLPDQLAQNTVNIATVSEFKAHNYLTIGQRVRIAERAGAIYSVVSSLTVVNDGSRAIGHNTKAIALKLEVKDGIAKAKELGFKSQSGFDNKSVLDGLDFNDIAEILFEFGTYEFSEIDLRENTVLLSGVAGRTTLKVHSSAAVSDWIKLGSANQIVTGGGLRGFKIEGDNKQRNGLFLKNNAAITLEKLNITGFSICILGFGALSSNFHDITCSNYVVGARFRKSEASDSVTVYPNHIQFTGQTHFTGGSGEAVDYDDGVGLFFEKLQLDFTGTSGNTATGGIFIGGNVGSELSVPAYPALRIQNAIFESVRGRTIHVNSGSVVLDNITATHNEDAYVFNTTSSVLIQNFVDGSSGAQIKLNPANNRSVFINTVLTDGIIATSGDLHPKTVLINSGTGAQAQNGFRDLSLFDLAINSAKLADTALTIGGIQGFKRVTSDPVSTVDTEGYQYVKANNYAGKDGCRQRARSHAWHNHNNGFLMGIDDSGNVSANSFSPFTGVHYFYSKTPIRTGVAVDLIDCTERDVVIVVDDEKFMQPFKTNGKVAVSKSLSKVCAGVVMQSVAIESGYLISVAAVGDNRSGQLKGFLVDSCQAGDILCTGTGGKLQVAPSDIEREVVTFKAMSQAKGGLAYGYF